MASYERLDFCDEPFDNKYMLFELPSNEMLEDVMSEKIKLEIVSNERDPVVLCTNKDGNCATFDILEFDTSNCLLVHEANLIVSRNYSTFELRRKPPPFLEVRAMLHDNWITDSEIRGETILNPILYDVVFETVLCSKEEFDAILRNLSAININGAIKTAPREKFELIGNRIIRYAMTQSDWMKINVKGFMDDLAIPLIEYPIMKDLVRAEIRYFAIDEDGDEIVLDEKKIMRFIAQSILRKARQGYMRDSDFQEAMLGLMPPSTSLDAECTYGVAVHIDGKVQYVDEETLPLNFDERLAALLDISKAWEENELKPFFAYFVTDELPFGDLMQRHARFVNGMWMKL